jgi:hypothetical protein
MSNPLPAFWLKLREAQQACSKVDAYDLRSQDIMSAAVYNQLLEEQRAAARRLIRHCLRHRKHLEKVLAT